MSLPTKRDHTPSLTPLPFDLSSHPMTRSFAAVVLLTIAACGSAIEPPPPAEPPPVEESWPVKENPGIVAGRVTGADSPSLWTGGVLAYAATPPEARMIATTAVDTAGHFEISLPACKFNIPYAVVAFRDLNGNGEIDRGEDFVGSEARGPGGKGEGFLLFTARETFIGGRARSLEKTEFVIDVSL